MSDLVIPTSRRKTGKKSKRKDMRPARARYWATRRLEERKIQALIKHCGMSRQSAFNRWHAERKTRVKDGFLKNVA